MNDRRLEVVGHYGTWHLGKLHIGMSRALQLAQCARVVIRTSAPLPMQVDGEPWMQEEPCAIAIEHHGQALMLRRLRGAADGAVMGVVSHVLDAALEDSFISGEQHRALLTEIGRRL
jgi:diacylglycerol kinase (ATP)